MPNRLALESSPYLQQHADNPVEWHPWGAEALEKAKAEDKPIFLSIGYAACHWCHVMAHESFEDERVAAILNEHYVSIKVDREERPDIDRIYMAAVQALTGRGGWPMSVFLTPDGQPFYAGTYFPPTARYGMPGFPDVLRAIVDAWRGRRTELADGARQLVQAIGRQMEPAVSAQGGGASQTDQQTLEGAFERLEQSYDRSHGGWGGAPKFPQPMVLEFLLRYYHRTHRAEALGMVRATLDAMARGGMYDQLGGGFHRYSVDDHWLVPHFEKMLYDNAQLARVYLHVWQVTNEPLYRAVAEEVLDYVVREMTDAAGGFYATQDADSEGEEGKFFIWTPGEIRAVLGAEADLFSATYGVTERGNFEGRNILTLLGTSSERSALAQARSQLFAARERRVHPGRDEKVIGAWNGLMLGAFAEAARVLGRDDYRQVAERNAAFLLRALRRPDGRLWHTWSEGQARLNGYLDDYANILDGLVELYQTTFDTRWYVSACELAEVMAAHFAAPEGGFYDTSDDHERLIVRPRELQDNALPSGNALAAYALLRLAGLAVEPAYVERARRAVSLVQPLLAQYPLAFGQWLTALAYAASEPIEVAIVGKADDPALHALLGVCRTGYRPRLVVALAEADQPAETVPLLRGRAPLEGSATAYVCSGFTCQPPVVDPHVLSEMLVVCQDSFSL